jgi:tetratricopeptide (TPR) repeat protein
LLTPNRARFQLHTICCHQNSPLSFYVKPHLEFNILPKYHIALSFAGEERPYVEKVAAALKAEGVEVFYDMFEEAELWGKDLYSYLSDIYQNRAVFTVMFVSKAYESKLWTNHERKSAQARAFSENKEYILPAIFDETVEVPGLLKTTGHTLLKKKTPEQLATLIVQKLKKAGISVSQAFAYSESAKADVDFQLSKENKACDVIRALKVYTWGIQNSAFQSFLELDWPKVSADQAFVLGRNLYQSACGGERRVVSAIEKLRSELAQLPEDRAKDVLNGMFFEVYFDSTGEFRGRKLKKRYLRELLALQKVKKFEESIMFIRRALKAYRQNLLFLPATDPELVSLAIQIRRSDPPEIKTIKIKSKNILEARSKEEDSPASLWKISYQTFTLEALRERLSEEWGIPLDQLILSHSPPIDPKTKLRLPEDSVISWPVET